MSYSIHGQTATKFEEKLSTHGAQFSDSWADSDEVWRKAYLPMGRSLVIHGQIATKFEVKLSTHGVQFSDSWADSDEVWSQAIYPWRVILTWMGR